MQRCPWCLSDPLYVRYHDEEWGVPVHDDRLMFEFLLLETFQAGLSWLTILRKRENFRRAFAAFDPGIVAQWGPTDEARLLADAGIVRNRAKVAAAIANARAFLALQGEKGSFAAYLWDFVGGSPLVNRFETLAELPPATPLSETISRDLRRRGFRFVGPTVVYAHLQATGLVNDHLVSCFRHPAAGGGPR